MWQTIPARALVIDSGVAQLGRGPERPQGAPRAIGARVSGGGAGLRDSRSVLGVL